MTMPFERTWAVNNTREFLRDLLDPKKTPRVPKNIRLEAYRLLKHYPTKYHMECVVDEQSTVFAESPWSKRNEDNT
jgi:hypothetical protein